jgi:hypothetical protein
MAKRVAASVVVFKVALQGRKGIWRRIAVRSDQTLDDLHEAAPVLHAQRRLLLQHHLTLMSGGVNKTARKHNPAPGWIVHETWRADRMKNQFNPLAVRRGWDRGNEMQPRRPSRPIKVPVASTTLLMRPRVSTVTSLCPLTP